MDMPRENQIFLHLLKTASNDVEYRIFLSFHNALLQGTVDLGIGNWRGRGSNGLPSGHMGLRAHDTQLHALQIPGCMYLPVCCGQIPEAIVPETCYHQTGSVQRFLDIIAICAIVKRPNLIVVFKLEIEIRSIHGGRVFLKGITGGK